MIAGVGSGKTFSLCLEAIRKSVEFENSQGVIVASTYRNLNDFVIPMLTEELWERMGQREAWHDLVESYNKQDQIIRLINGSKIFLRSCDRPDNLRGPNLSWFAIDEAAKVPHKVWKLMVARLRIPPEKGWIATTPRGRNWVWEEFARKPRKNYVYFTGSTLENRHVSEGYVESLLESYSGSFLRQEVYGEFVGWEGLVYQITLDRHHSPPPKDYEYALMGADWGWIDPSVLLVGLVSRERIYLVEEYVAKKTPIDKLAEKAVELSRKWRVRTCWCDPSRPEYIAELRNRGLDARKGKRELDPGIAAVNLLLDEGRLLVDFNACPETVREFEVYHYEEDDMGTVLKNRPTDRDNHTMDALRYMIMGYSRRGYVGQRGIHR